MPKPAARALSVGIGSVIWLPDLVTYGAAAIDHAYVVISDPDESGNVLMVNLTDAGNISDRSCCFAKGEHPAITKDSVACYGRMMNANESLLQELARDYPRRIHPTPFTPELITRMHEGLMKSHHSSPAHKKIIADYMEQASALPPEVSN